MGKLHQIKRAYLALPERQREQIARVGNQYSVNVTFDKKGNAIICRNSNPSGCDHDIDDEVGKRLLSENPKHTKSLKDWKEIRIFGDIAHKPKRPYYFAHYILGLGLRHGYVNRKLKNYTRIETVRRTYNCANLEIAPGQWYPKHDGKKLEAEQIEKLKRPYKDN